MRGKLFRVFVQTGILFAYIDAILPKKYVWYAEKKSNVPYSYRKIPGEKRCETNRNLR